MSAGCFRCSWVCSWVKIEHSENLYHNSDTSVITMYSGTVSTVHSITDYLLFCCMPSLSVLFMLR